MLIDDQGRMLRDAYTAITGKLVASNCAAVVRSLMNPSASDSTVAELGPIFCGCRTASDNFQADAW